MGDIHERESSHIVGRWAFLTTVQHELKSHNVTSMETGHCDKIVQFQLLSEGDLVKKVHVLWQLGKTLLYSPTKDAVEFL